MTTASSKAARDPEAPHGRDTDGTPLAPYGLKADGTPKVSNRGRKSSGTAPAPKSSSAREREAREKAKLLADFGDALLTPVYPVVRSGVLKKRFGEKKADALAGSLVILDAFVPRYAEHAVAWDQSHPGFLSWMDRIDDKTPIVAMAFTTIELVKALAGNWSNPDPRLAHAALTKSVLRPFQLAEAIEAEARRLGINPDDIEAEARRMAEPEPQHEAAAA